METNVPSVLKVQASEVGLEVQKYPQKAQNIAKKNLITDLNKLVPQNCLDPDKNVL